MCFDVAGGWSYFCLWPSSGEPAVAAGDDVDTLYPHWHSMKDDCSTIWETITILSSKVSETSQIGSMVSTLYANISSVTAHSTSMTATLQTLHSDFMSLYQCINHLKEFTQLLNSEQESFAKALQILRSNSSVPHFPSGSNLETSLHTLQA